VTRTILATAALIAAGTLFTSAANACISCEYVPEVVRSSSTLPHTGHYYAAEPYAKKARSAVEARKRIVKAEPVAKVNIAKADKVERTETKAETKVAKADPAETTKDVESESSSISLASNDVAAVKDTVAKVVKEVSAKPTDCKKFFASVGMTLTVPCE
jgi:hypothetical protein